MIGCVSNRRMAFKHECSTKSIFVEHNARLTEMKGVKKANPAPALQQGFSLQDRYQPKSVWAKSLPL